VKNHGFPGDPVKNGPLANDLCLSWGTPNHKEFAWGFQKPREKLDPPGSPQFIMGFSGNPVKKWPLDTHRVSESPQFIMGFSGNPVKNWTPRAALNLSWGFRETP